MSGLKSVVVPQSGSGWKNARRDSSLWVYYKEAKSYLKDRSQQGRLWTDYSATRSWFKGISGEIPPEKEGCVALIGCMSAYLYGNKLESMLGLGLRLAGWRTRVLLNSRKDLVPRRVFGSFGFDDFVYWEDFEAEVGVLEEGTVDQMLDQWMSGDLTIQSVKQWTLGPCWLGPQIISMLHRREHRVDLNLNTPEIRKALISVTKFTIARARRAEAILAKVQPELLYLMEPNYAQFGPLVDHAVHRKVRVIHTVQPIRDDAMYFWRLDMGTRREHPLTVTKKTLDVLVEQPWTEAHEKGLQDQFSARYSGKWFLQRRNQLDATPCSKSELVGQLGLNPEKKIACVFSHVLWDANLFYGTDLFDDYGDWFVQTVKAAYQNDRVNWLIKLHPANISKRRQEQIKEELAETILIREKCGPVPDHVRILLPDCGISSLSLYEIADCGVTVRGTCGIEMPCFGTPVITAGTGRYSGLGFTVDCASREEYLKRLSEIDSIQSLTDAQILRAKQHAYTLFIRRPWKMKSFRAEFNEDLKSDKPIADPLFHNLQPTVKSIAEIHNQGDLKKWATWAESGTTPDYVDPDE